MITIRNTTLPLLLFILLASNLFAYETDWNDKKYPSEGTLNNSLFRLDGVTYTGYEVPGKQRGGKIEDGTNHDETGFIMERAYLNIRGDVQEGPFKGWGYQFTPDLVRASTEYNNCDAISAPCTGSNNYLLYMKFAFVKIPIFNGGQTQIRVGLQHTPVIGGQAGVHLLGMWGYRYLGISRAHSPIGQLGLSTSADNGISFLHRDHYFSTHLLLSNGEGYNRTDAERMTSPTLGRYSTGSGDSYGYDFIGIFSIVPTGAAKQHQAMINLVWKQQNAVGMDSSEYEEARWDVTDLDDPKFQIMRGNKRAKQDSFYGTEINYIFNPQNFTITTGVGHMMRLDQRSSAYILDSDVIHGIDPEDQATIMSHFIDDEDQRGHANYFYIHGRYGKFGGVFRYMQGVSNGILGTTLGTTSHKPYLAKMINADAADGEYGNLTYLEAASLETSKSRFQQYLVGLTYFATNRFQVTVGISQIMGTELNGDPHRENNLEGINGYETDQTVAQQLEQNEDIKDELNVNEDYYAMNLNDFIGKKRMIEEIFIRAQLAF